jgi:flagellar biosynthesis/type III secretory pathway chaperone
MPMSDKTWEALQVANERVRVLEDENADLKKQVASQAALLNVANGKVTFLKQRILGFVDQMKSMAANGANIVDGM